MYRMNKSLPYSNTHLMNHLLPSESLRGATFSTLWATHFRLFSVKIGAPSEWVARYGNYEFKVIRRACIIFSLKILISVEIAFVSS